jgi:hypothetical protein
VILVVGTSEEAEMHPTSAQKTTRRAALAQKKRGHAARWGTYRRCGDA